MKHYLIYLHGLMALLKTFLIGNKSLNSFSPGPPAVRRSAARPQRNTLQHFGKNYKLSLFKKYSI